MWMYGIMIMCWEGVAFFFFFVLHFFFNKVLFSYKILCVIFDGCDTQLTMYLIWYIKLDDNYDDDKNNGKFLGRLSL